MTTTRRGARKTPKLKLQLSLREQLATSFRNRDELRVALVERNDEARALSAELGKARAHGESETARADEWRSHCMKARDGRDEAKRELGRTQAERDHANQERDAERRAHHATEQERERLFRRALRAEAALRALAAFVGEGR